MPPCSLEDSRSRTFPTSPAVGSRRISLAESASTERSRGRGRRAVSRAGPCGRDAPLRGPCRHASRDGPGHGTLPPRPVNLPPSRVKSPASAPVRKAGDTEWDGPSVTELHWAGLCWTGLHRTTLQLS
eukprot:6091042-Pyramimonas_sp.AAC.1